MRYRTITDNRLEPDMNQTVNKIDKITLITRFALFVLIWWSLTNGSTRSWVVGVPAILIVTLISVRLQAPTGFSWPAFIKFIPFFISHSLSGGLDVARRAFQPSMPIAPGLIEYTTQLPAGLARAFMLNTTSLLPGTLNAALDENTLKVHVLDIHNDNWQELVKVESHVAAIFNVKLLDRDTTLE